MEVKSVILAYFIATLMRYIDRLLFHIRENGEWAFSKLFYGNMQEVEIYSANGASAEIAAVALETVRFNNRAPPGQRFKYVALNRSKKCRAALVPLGRIRIKNVYIKTQIWDHEQCCSIKMTLSSANGINEIYKFIKSARQNMEDGEAKPERKIYFEGVPDRAVAKAERRGKIGEADLRRFVSEMFLEENDEKDAITALRHFCGMVHSAERMNRLDRLIILLHGPDLANKTRFVRELAHYLGKDVIITSPGKMREMDNVVDLFHDTGVYGPPSRRLVLVEDIDKSPSALGMGGSESSSDDGPREAARQINISNILDNVVEAGNGIMIIFMAEDENNIDSAVFDKNLADIRSYMGYCSAKLARRVMKYYSGLPCGEEEDSALAEKTLSGVFMPSQIKAFCDNNPNMSAKLAEAYLAGESIYSMPSSEDMTDKSSIADMAKDKPAAQSREAHDSQAKMGLKKASGLRGMAKRLRRKLTRRQIDGANQNSPKATCVTPIGSETEESSLMQSSSAEEY